MEAKWSRAIVKLDDWTLLFVYLTTRVGNNNADSKKEISEKKFKIYCWYKSMLIASIHFCPRDFPKSAFWLYIVVMQEVLFYSSIHFCTFLSQFILAMWSTAHCAFWKVGVLPRGVSLQPHNIRSFCASVVRFSIVV